MRFFTNTDSSLSGSKPHSSFCPTIGRYFSARSQNLRLNTDWFEWLFSLNTLLKIQLRSCYSLRSKKVSFLGKKLFSGFSTYFIHIFLHREKEALFCSRKTKVSPEFISTLQNISFGVQKFSLRSWFFRILLSFWSSIQTRKSQRT